MGGNMPNVQLYQNNMNNGRPSICTCTCGDRSFTPPASCTTAQTCVAYCLQMFSGQCTVVNTYGCCGSSCQYFQAQSLETRYCTCNCAGQHFVNPIDTCVSTQACLTRCLTNFPQACTPTATQACCGQDCQTYSQAVSDACACRCQGNTYYPSPKCTSSEGCVSTCMTVSENVRENLCLFENFYTDLRKLYSRSNSRLLWSVMLDIRSNMYMQLWIRFHNDYIYSLSKWSNLFRNMFAFI